jgi:hypothetical protein
MMEKPGYLRCLCGMALLSTWYLRCQHIRSVRISHLRRPSKTIISHHANFAGNLFNQSQRPDERVDYFVTRLKRCARRLNIADDTLNFAIIHGLRSPIRLHVLQQGVQDLQQTLRAARFDEACTTTDPLTALLLETIETTTQAAEKRAADVKDLSWKVSVLSTGGITAPVIQRLSVTNAVGPSQTHPAARASENYRRNNNFRPPVVKQTPRNI